MRVTVSSKGDWKKTKKWFAAMGKKDYLRELDRLGQQGVQALRSMTPVESGATAAGWYYEVVTTGGQAGIAWYNNHSNNGVNIAIILQYGHGTGTGGWVAGRDYINPAIKPVMDQIAENVWKAVVTA